MTTASCAAVSAEGFESRIRGSVFRAWASADRRKRVGEPSAHGACHRAGIAPVEEERESFNIDILHVDEEKEFFARTGSRGQRPESASPTSPPPRYSPTTVACPPRSLSVEQPHTRSTERERGGQETVVGEYLGEGEVGEALSGCCPLNPL